LLTLEEQRLQAAEARCIPRSSTTLPGVIGQYYLRGRAPDYNVGSAIYAQAISVRTVRADVARIFCQSLKICPSVIAIPKASFDVVITSELIEHPENHASYDNAEWKLFGGTRRLNCVKFTLLIFPGHH
jgi:hypothetical protein